MKNKNKRSFTADALFTEQPIDLSGFKNKNQDLKEEGEGHLSDEKNNDLTESKGDSSSSINKDTSKNKEKSPKTKERNKTTSINDPKTKGKKNSVDQFLTDLEKYTQDVKHSDYEKTILITQKTHQKLKLIQSNSDVNIRNLTEGIFNEWMKKNKKNIEKLLSSRTIEF